jgi:hypothetical protein
MMNYYSALDRGHESHDCHYEDPTNNVNFCFPSGTDLPWGNRDYDINLTIAGKAWDQVGQLWFNIFNKDGFLGDQMLVNWLYKPYLDVRQRRYLLQAGSGSGGTGSPYGRNPGAPVTGRIVEPHSVSPDRQ